MKNATLEKKRKNKREEEICNSGRRKEISRERRPMQLRKIKETRKEEEVEEGLCNGKRKHLEHKVSE
jgi:hypothetical protein